MQSSKKCGYKTIRAFLQTNNLYNWKPGHDIALNIIILREAASVDNGNKNKLLGIYSPAIFSDNKQTSKTSE